MRHVKALLGAVLLSSLVTMRADFTAEAEKPLDNAEIVKLAELDMGDAVIIAKIKAAKSVQFETGRGDVEKLKAVNVSQEVVAAMLDRSAADAKSRAEHPTVALEATNRTRTLASVEGTVRTVLSSSGWVTVNAMTQLVTFPGDRSTVRTTDRTPSITVTAPTDPSESFWVVRLGVAKQDGEVVNRFVQSYGQGFEWSYATDEPAKTYRVKCDVAEIRPGLWRFTPTKKLKPREYGIYAHRKRRAPLVFDFGIDK